MDNTLIREDIRITQVDGIVTNVTWGI